MDLEKDELQPFNPRDPLYRYKLWVRVVSPDYTHYHVFWGRVTAAAATLAVAAWLGLAAAIWAFLVHQREWTDARYVDLALYPWRADEFRHGLAEHQLAQGKRELKNQNYITGYSLLVSGLKRVPEDLQARRLVAVTHLRAGMLHRALDTLADGLAYNPDLDYVKLAFGWLIESGEFDRAIQLATPLLPETPDTDLTHQYLALQVATAHFESGRYDAAEQWLARWSLANSLEGVLLLARADWETGRKAEALQRLENEIPRFAGRDELYVSLIRFHRELGHEAEARRFALLRQFNDPQNPGPRIDLLHTYHATQDSAAQAREIDAYFAAFGTDARAMAVLAWFAVDTHQQPLLDRIHLHATEAKLATDEIDLARVQLALITRRYAEAMAISEPAFSAATRANAGRPRLMAAFHAVATYAGADSAKASMALRALTAEARFPLRDSLVLARELQLVGAVAEARLVLERACLVDPFAQPALAELVRIDAATKNQEGLATYLPKFLAVRKPSRAILTEVLLALDRSAQPALFEQVRAALQRNGERLVSTSTTAALP